MPKSSKLDKSSDNRGSIPAPGLLPRSIGQTVHRLQTEFNPHAETDILQQFRRSRSRTQRAVRFLILLALVPLLTQQISKHWLIRPLVNQYYPLREERIFLNSELREQAFRELQEYEEELRFSHLLGPEADQLDRAATERKLHERVAELALEFRDRSRNALSNVFADLVASLGFILLLLTHPLDLANLKTFMDEIIYGLSDTAKAFFLILFTDMFVGFHSPHGWEVLLEGLANHLGLVPNHAMISLFIATVPVVMDTIFKYWIFRYLSRLSPSAAATLRNMNE